MKELDKISFTKQEIKNKYNFFYVSDTATEGFFRAMSFNNLRYSFVNENDIPIVDLSNNNSYREIRNFSKLPDGEIYAPVYNERCSFHIRAVLYKGEIYFQKAYDSKFDDVGNFTNGINRAVAIEGKKYFHIDPNGKPVYNERYDYVGSYSEQGIAVAKLGDNYQHIDINGKPIYKTKYDFLGSFSNKEALAVAGKNEKFFHIHTDGTPAYRKRYDQLKTFDRSGVGLAKAMQYYPEEDHGPWFFINQNGERIDENNYFVIRNFFNGLCSVKTTGVETAFRMENQSLWYQVLPNGKPAYKERYLYLGKHSHKHIPVVNLDGEYFHLDKNGKPAYGQRYEGFTPDHYCEVPSHSTNLRVKMVGEGTEDLRENNYGDIGSFTHQDLCIVRKDEKYFQIKSNGYPAYSMRFDYLIDSGLALKYSLGKIENREKYIYLYNNSFYFDDSKRDFSKSQLQNTSEEEKARQMQNHKIIELLETIKDNIGDVSLSSYDIDSIVDGIKNGNFDKKEIDELYKGITGKEREHRRDND